MKPVIIVAILIAAQLPCSAKPKLYSRKLAEQQIADSLRTIDSLRVVDSIRVADSCMVARYKVVDKVRKKESKQRTDSMISEMFIFEDFEPIATEVHDDADAVSARSIIIAPDNPLARKVDSLEAEYNRQNDLLHDGDSHFKKMKSFAISEKKRYLRFLLEHKMKDTAQVTAYCNSLNALYKLRLEFFVAIQKSQQGNAKSFIKLHIEEHRKKMDELGVFILALTPEVPFYPQRANREEKR